MIQVDDTWKASVTNRSEEEKTRKQKHKKEGRKKRSSMSMSASSTSLMKAPSDLVTAAEKQNAILVFVLRMPLAFAARIHSVHTKQVLQPDASPPCLTDEEVVVGCDLYVGGG